MFAKTVDELVSEFQQRLGASVTIPWGWIFTKLATLLTRYPTGITKAIMFAELECSWRKIEKLHAKGTLQAADSLQSVVLSKHLSPLAVFEVLLKEVKNIEGTHTRIAVIEESKSGSTKSSSESSFTIEMFLHQKLYAEVDKIMAHGHKLRFTGCRLFQGRQKKTRLLPSENFVEVLDDNDVENFCQNLASLEVLHCLNESQYLKNIIKVEVVEITQKECIHFQHGHTANRIVIHVVDECGIQAKFQLWEEYLVMANLFEEGDYLFIKQCFVVPDQDECFVLEYGPETLIYCQPSIHQKEVLPSQKDCSKFLYISKDSKGMLDCSMYPEQLGISEIKQNMTNIILCGKIVFVGSKKIQRSEGFENLKYDIKVQDETGVCNVAVVEPYKGATSLHCGQFVLMKNLHVSAGYSMGVSLDLNIEKDGKFWNLSSLQGWLATSSICAIISLACQKVVNTDSCVIKGVLSCMAARHGDKTVVRAHCSCQGTVVEDMDGQLRCEKCLTKGMVELPGNNAPKLFSLDNFWSWQYCLCITIRESDHHRIQAYVTNKVAETLLQLPASQLHLLASDGQRRVLECTLGLQCLFGLSNFKGNLLVSAVNQI